MGADNTCCSTRSGDVYEGDLKAPLILDTMNDFQKFELSLPFVRTSATFYDRAVRAAAEHDKE